MIVQVKLAIALVVAVAGGGAVAANQAAIFGGSEPSSQVSTSHRAAVDTSAKAGSGATVTVPTVPRGTVTWVTPASSSVDASAAGSASAARSASASGSVEARLALEIVQGLQAKCQSVISKVSGAAQQLTAVPTNTSAVFEVKSTASGSATSPAAGGSADSRATLLVNVSTNTVTSADPATAAALSACSALTAAPRSSIDAPLPIGGGTATLGVGG